MTVSTLVAVLFLYQSAVVFSQCSLVDVAAANQQCTVLDSCSGLRCGLSPPFDRYTATYNVSMRCADPVQVHLFLESAGSGLPYENVFEQSEIVLFGGGTHLNVTIGRNSTHLDFQATIYYTESDPVTVFPEVFVSLDPADCMCSSLRTLASRAETIHPAVESNCRTLDVALETGTAPCAAVQCTLTVAFIFTYNVKLIPLPCNDSVTFIVTNVFDLPVVTEIFQGPTDETRPVTIDIFNLNVRQIIRVYNYSMEVQTYLSESSIGTLEIVPLQRIILDKRQCDLPLLSPNVMTTIAPPPSLPSPGSSYTCFRWYDIAQRVYNSSLIFRCALKSDCNTGLDCILAIVHTVYRVGISYVNDVLTFAVTSEDGRTTYPADGGVAASLPMPSGSQLLLRQDTDQDLGFVGFQLDLTVTFLSSSEGSRQRVDTLIPYSTFLTQTDSCSSLGTLLTDNPQCRAIGCSGLTCQLSAPFNGYIASYDIFRCADPVYVDITLVPASLERQAFTTRVVQSNATDVHFGGGSGMSIDITRNATHLDLQATIYSPGAPPSTLFPESLHSLGPADCMCSTLESLAAMAQTLHPAIESNCGTTRSCSAIRCQVNIATIAAYFIETVVLPCNNSIEFLIENESGGILVADRFQGPGTETRTVQVLNFQFQVEVSIEVQDYSMRVQAFLVDTILGRFEIIPKQTVLLDRTQCDIPQFPTIAMPTRLPPPPQPLTSDAPTVCITLTSLAQSIYTSSPNFRCVLKEQCESGLTCVLDIAHVQYRVNVTVGRGSVVFSVDSLDGRSMYGMSVNMNATVELPSPADSFLVFVQSTENQQTIGFGLQLQASFFGTQPQSEELIPYTTITWPPSINVGLVVSMVTIFTPLTVALVVLTIIVLACYIHNRRNKWVKDQAFDFQEMSDLENYVNTDPNDPLPRTGVGASVDDEDDFKKVDLSAVD